MTTWGDLEAGATVLDGNGGEWQVNELEEREPGIITAHVSRGNAFHVVTPPADQPVTLKPPELTQVQEAFAPDEVTLVAVATDAEQEATVFPPWEHMTDLQSRSHLYLVHQAAVSSLISRPDMDRVHAEMASRNEHTHEVRDE